MVNKNIMPPLDLQPQTITSIKKTIEHLVVFVGGFFIVLGIILGGSYFMTPSKTTAGPCTGSVAPKVGAVDPNLIDNKPTKYWRLNNDGLSQRYIYLSSTGRENRMRELLSHYDNAPAYETRQVIARIYRIYPEVLLCIAYADSSLGNYLKTPNNFGNVNNNDRGNKQAYVSPEAGVNAIGKVLSNQYLGNKITIGDLSYAGDCKTDCQKVYATSNQNRQINTLNCLGMIRNKEVKPNFAFRW